MRWCQLNGSWHRCGDLGARTRGALRRVAARLRCGCKQPGSVQRVQSLDPSVQRSPGVSPVLLARRASIRGLISSRSWNAKTTSSSPCPPPAAAVPGRGVGLRCAPVDRRAPAEPVPGLWPSLPMPWSRRREHQESRAPRQSSGRQFPARTPASASWCAVHCQFTLERNSFTAQPTCRRKRAERLIPPSPLPASSRHDPCG
jgi:hypothetical protein